MIEVTTGCNSTPKADGRLVYQGFCNSPPTAHGELLKEQQQPDKIYSNPHHTIHHALAAVKNKLAISTAYYQPYIFSS